MAFNEASGGLFLKRNTQIIYAFALITLIPFAIIANTFFFIRSFSRTIDLTLQRQALLVAQVFNAGSQDILSDPVKLQERVENTAKFTGDIRSLDVLMPEGENFKVVASLDKTAVGAVSTSIQNVLAWHENRAIAYLTRAGGTSIVSEQVEAPGQRFWAVISPLQDSNGQKRALLAMKISVSVIDNLTQHTLFQSYIILAITVVIIILLLILNTRMFEYALLFRKIKEVDKMKDEFISMASHELRTPITGIKGYVSLFIEGAFGKLSDEAMKNMKTVYGAVERLADLIEDLLNVSRIEQGRLDIRVEPVEPVKLINGLLNELNIQAQQKNLYLKFEIAEEPLPRIMADTARLKQVIVNVVGNAIKYTPKGGVTVSLMPKEKFLEIKVTDTGIGMSAKARERLFEKFYRVKSVDTEKITGTGLGLWITKQMVELMKGEIYVDSIEHVGTQVSILLPFESAKKV